jgi:hypothetical protein
MWRFLAAALAVLICNLAANAQEKKPVSYGVKSGDCKTAATCRIQCTSDKHILVMAACNSGRQDTGRKDKVKYDGKHKASCPAPGLAPMFGLCMERGALAPAKK